MAMIYEAGNTLAVTGEMSGIQDFNNLYDAGEIEAVRAKIQGAGGVEGMAYSAGKFSALIAAMGQQSGEEVESRKYADIPAVKKLYGSLKKEAGVYELISIGGIVVKIVVVDNGDGSISIKPSTFYCDIQTQPISTINYDFDIFVDDNNYLKMYANNQEYFFYSDASKTQSSRIKCIQINKVDTSARLTQLFDEATKNIVTMSFRVWNLAEDGYLKIDLSPQPGNPLNAMVVVSTDDKGNTKELWNTQISSSSHLKYLITRNQQMSWNFKKSTSNQLVVEYNGVDYPEYFDKTQLEKVECSYFEIITSDAR